MRPPCVSCGKPSVFSCRKCRETRYCSDVCQKEEYEVHVHVCGVKPQSRAVLESLVCDYDRDIKSASSAKEQKQRRAAIIQLVHFYWDNMSKESRFDVAGVHVLNVGRPCKFDDEVLLRYVLREIHAKAPVASERCLVDFLGKRPHEACKWNSRIVQILADNNIQYKGNAECVFRSGGSASDQKHVSLISESGANTSPLPPVLQLTRIMIWNQFPLSESKVYAERFPKHLCSLMEMGEDPHESLAHFHCLALAQEFGPTISASDVASAVSSIKTAAKQAFDSRASHVAQALNNNGSSMIRELTSIVCSYIVFDDRSLAELFSCKL